MFHPLQPYGNMYGTPEIISFDPGVVPVSPFGVPSYMPSFSGGMQNPYAFMGMRSMPSPMLPGVQQPLSHTGLGIHDNVKSQNAPSERGVRENDYDSNSADYHDGDGRRTSQERYQPEKSYERGYHESNTTIQKRHHKDKYCSPAHENLCYSSDDELVDQKHRKELGSYGREMRSHYTKQSASEVHDIPNISIPDTRQRNKQHDRSASGKRDEIRAKSKSEYTENTRHQSHKENIRMDRSDDGHKSSKSTYGHKHRVQETYYATDYKHDSKIKRSSQSSRHDKTKVGSSVGHVGRDRWAMEDGRPDDYERRDHYRHKTKRRH